MQWGRGVPRSPAFAIPGGGSFPSGVPFDPPLSWPGSDSLSTAWRPLTLTAAGGGRGLLRRDLLGQRAQEHRRGLLPPCLGSVRWSRSIVALVSGQRARGGDADTLPGGPCLVYCLQASRSSTSRASSTWCSIATRWALSSTKSTQSRTTCTTIRTPWALGRPQSPRSRPQPALAPEHVPEHVAAPALRCWQELRLRRCLEVSSRVRRRPPREEGLLSPRARCSPVAILASLLNWSGC